MGQAHGILGFSYPFSLLAASVRLHGTSPWHLGISYPFCLLAASVRLHGTSPWHLLQADMIACDILTAARATNDFYAEVRRVVFLPLLHLRFVCVCGFRKAVRFRYASSWRRRSFWASSAMISELVSDCRARVNSRDVTRSMRTRSVLLIDSWHKKAGLSFAKAAVFMSA